MKRHESLFLFLGSGLTIAFLIVVNFLTNTSYPWFIYPVFALLLFPIGLYCIFEKKHTLFSVIGSIVILTHLIAANYINTPNYPWFLYAIGPIVLWPVLSFLGNRNKNLFVASVISMLFILYYGTMNIYLSSAYPWSIFPSFAILWWPLSLYHVKRKTYFAFSINATLLISLFFISVNVFFSPGTIWSIYPIFTVLWWPLSMYYYSYKRKVDY